MGCSTSSIASVLNINKKQLKDTSTNPKSRNSSKATLLGPDKNSKIRNNKNLNIVQLESHSFHLTYHPSSMEDKMLPPINGPFSGPPMANRLEKVQNIIYESEKRKNVKMQNLRNSNKLPFLSKRVMNSIALKSKSKNSSSKKDSSDQKDLNTSLKAKMTLSITSEVYSPQVFCRNSQQYYQGRGSLFIPQQQQHRCYEGFKYCQTADYGKMS